MDNEHFKDYLSAFLQLNREKFEFLEKGLQDNANVVQQLRTSHRASVHEQKREMADLELALRREIEKVKEMKVHVDTPSQAADVPDLAGINGRIDALDTAINRIQPFVQNVERLVQQRVLELDREVTSQVDQRTS